MPGPVMASSSPIADGSRTRWASKLAGRLLFPFVLLAAAAAAGAELAASRQDVLVHLLRHDCGSCHGLTLAGGLGPPLTADALANKSDASLSATILYGRPGTPMPPWQSMLTEEEVRWLVALLKSGSLQ